MISYTIKIVEKPEEGRGKTIWQMWIPEHISFLNLITAVTRWISKECQK